MPILQRAGRSTLALASIMGVALPMAVSADPLNPLEFPSAGTVTLAAGQTYTINSTAGTFTGPSVNLTGTYRGNTLVFAFDALTVPATAVINTTGRKPMALLSRGDLSFAGALSRNGSNGEPSVGTTGGLGGDGAGCGGGGRSGDRNPGGGIGGAPALVTVATGGSFGGAGGGLPGPTYGNLMLQLEGGSGGSAGATSSNSGGGAGGGAIELGAIGVLSLNAGATITANGGSSTALITGNSGGGGSGGGILLHAATIQIAGASVQAKGGSSGNPQRGGGGGRIALQSTNTPDLTGFSVDTAGSGGGQQPGVITSARVTLVAPDLDFGDVAVGSSRMLFMAAQNTGDPDTSVNGQFPDAMSPFARTGDGVFSGVKPGRAAANAYTFTPTTTGDFSQQLTFLSNAGPVTVNITGRGVVPACLGDLNADGVVNTADLTRFLGRFGAPCP